jgi:integrase
MSRKGENIYKRKDGRWEGRYIKSRNQTGKAQYGYVYARSYRDLKIKLKNSSSTKKEKTDTSQKRATLSFDYIAQEWLQTKKAYVKESTFMRYSYLLENYILPVFGNYEISVIQNHDINNFSSMLLSTGGINNSGLATKSVADIVCLVNCIMKYAASKGNNTSYNGELTSIKQQSKEMRILSKNEQEIITNNLIESDDLRDIGILICLYTGIRVGELCALRWRDISLIEKTISIRYTLQRVKIENPENDCKTKILISAPKSQCSLRTIPIPNGIVSLIERRISTQDSFLLTGTSEKYIEPRTMQNHFKKVLKNNRIQKANFHCLRHTFATRCIEVGFDIKSLSEILGHANVNVTMNRYVHPTMELKRENMERLSILFAVK